MDVKFGLSRYNKVESGANIFLGNTGTTFQTKGVITKKTKL
jgi:hypothetical protein